MLDNYLGNYAPTKYVYGVGLDLSRVSAFYQSSSPYSPQLRFLGWYTDANFTTPASSITATQTGVVNFYAKWRYDFDNPSRYGTYTIYKSDPLNQSSDQVYTGLGQNGLFDNLKQIGIKSITIKFKIQLWELSDGTQYVYLYGGSDGKTKLKTVSFNGTSSAGVYEATFTLNLDEIGANNYLYIRYQASSHWLLGGRNWQNDRIYMEISYVAKESDINSPEFYWAYQDPFR